MYPAYVSFPLPDQFIYGWKGLEEGQILQPFIHRWQVYVCRLATEVLGVLHSAYGTVQFGATVAARYADGAEPVAQGLQYHVAQVCQVQYCGPAVILALPLLQAMER